MARRARPAVVSSAALGVLLVAGPLAGCSAAVGTSEPTDGTAVGAQAVEIPASELAQITTVHEATGMTLLEGPTFGPDGGLYVVDVTAPPGAAKVLRVDVESGDATQVYTDDTSVLTSAQFSPLDGSLYVTDFMGGRVLTMDADGTGAKPVFEGEVDGAPMNPDDLSFAENGTMYITDAAGAQDPYWEPTGRLVGVTADGSAATVLASDLASANGLAFTPDESGLWVTHNTGNQIDYLTLTDDGMQVATAHPAMHVDAGLAQVDSAAVDAAGNLYVGLHNRAAILVYDPTGKLIAEVTIPAEAGVSSATNIAIQPGTTKGYVTASGSDGGFVYTFDSLAEGIRQSNGG
ncbi:hypothetical protein C5E07_16675 [Pseudoclavibacter sp. RFBJ3]|uniref:SMP-30/gluconolactonase/LRE family protein n=1 Tax=unclassified Pseudoclavibacter TaxID=2615177 RepID=UPI000CE727C7|nr:MULTISPECIES: SMP-30/gluconolactonase/LRE family protein [unclassified Pseudoclavibacter]PPF87292.1 hypothetical protein C5C12_00485 [Pseudoclavibacter sp. RFBJ5]PPF90296.1 hypothetical protein C5E07_16675 [Pseudoclavibacter sp. RFBJ3]PPG00814.1 hypothetical protein C5C19_01270 [Pseudoclavibacter sp. RFBH5]PPG26074.1 hypothetical protein C5E13_00690 [Pseudoclavibacter sp. RFBI4]